MALHFLYGWNKTTCRKTVLGKTNARNLEPYFISGFAFKLVYYGISSGTPPPPRNVTYISIENIFN